MKNTWVWMPHNGHLIVGRWCRFHLNTKVGKFIVSTVGEYVPGESVRRIVAEGKGIVIEGRGEIGEREWLRKCGYMEIGCDRTYETMVFPAKRSDQKCCPFTAKVFREIDFTGYNTAEAAYAGHMKMCLKWANRKVPRSRSY